MVSQKIYDQLRSDIIAGRLQPNDRLTELELAEQFQSSQAPVREALQRLQEQGFVRIVKHTGTFVTEISTDEMKELFELRSVIERNAVKHAIYKSRKEDHEQLQDIVHEMQEAADENDLEKLIQQDMAFHQWIITKSGKKMLLQVWHLIDAQIRRYLNVTHPLFFNDLQDICDKHVTLLDHVLSGDVAQAEQAFEQHILISWSEIKELQDRHMGS